MSEEEQFSSSLNTDKNRTSMRTSVVYKEDLIGKWGTDITEYEPYSCLSSESDIYVDIKVLLLFVFYLLLKAVLFLFHSCIWQH